MIINMTGGGGTGAILTVASSGAGTVTVSNSTLGKSYSKAVSVGGTAVFKGLASGTWTITLSDGAGAETTQTVVIKADYSTSVAYFNATITITYPAGSTCTATDGVSNFTAPDTSGSWVLTVPNAGTWTVTATANDGSGNTKSQSVQITAEGQSESVALSYRQYLFDNDSIVEWTGDFGNEDYVSSGYRIGTTLYVKRTGSSGHNMWAAVYTAETVDISNYSRLVADISAASGSDIYLAVCKGSNADAKGELAAYTAIATGEVSVDISKLTGPYYITLNATYGQSGTATCTATKVWLE